MDQRMMEGMRERSRRPVRNKKYNRRTFAEEKRPPKRLFTPEIKRFLKDWLVRRRDNPYPNRDEKKSLAVQTGLTYIQVCNWFANWRRKLKNAGTEPQKKTWGHLIKVYNSQVQGNVEHFSICSDDSIWHEPELYEVNNSLCESRSDKRQMCGIRSEANCDSSTNAIKVFYKNSIDHCYISGEKNQNLLTYDNNNIPIQPQCFLVSSTSENDLEPNPFSQQKYKNHIMEKYLRDCQKPENYLTNFDESRTGDDAAKPSMISKWLESAANFKPSEKNYLTWTFPKTDKKKCKKTPADNNTVQQHGKEELDAAEALTTLANAHSLKL